MSIKMTDTDTKYDMLPWVCEKLRNSISPLIKTLEYTEDEDIRLNIQNSLRYLFKILFVSVGYNDNNCELLSNLFINNNLEFYYKFIYLALSDNENDYVDITDKDDIVYEEVMEAITPDDNKTELKTILRKYKNSRRSNKWILQLDDEIELVYFNEQTWDWFYNKHKNDKTKTKIVTRNDLIDMAKEI